jgi:malate permease and related proteins
LNIAELGSILLTIVIPVVLIAALGMVLARVFSLDSHTLSRLSLYLFSPTLVFTSIYHSQLGKESASVTAFVLISFGLMAVFSYGVIKAMRFDRVTSSAFMLSTLFVNAGNFGLPLDLFAFGQEGLNRAVIYYVGNSILTQSAAVFVAARGIISNRDALAQVFRMPIVYAATLALLFNANQWQIPEPLSKSLDLISGGTIPLVLVILGVELSRVSLSSDFLTVGMATFSRLVVASVMAFALAAIMGLEGVTRSVCILEASTPTAVLVAVLSSEFKVRPDIVTSVVFISTILSIVSMTLLIGILH